MKSQTLLSLALLAPMLIAGCDHGGACDPNKPNSICTIAGLGPSASHGDDGPATQALVYTPQQTAVGPDGQLWVMDYNAYRVRSIDDHGIITARVGIGMLGDSPDTTVGQTECPALQARFNHTPDLFFNGGYLYLAAWHASWIKRVELSTMEVTDLAGEGKRSLYTGDDGPALEAATDLPSSVTVAPSGDVVFMDQANQVIRRIDASGNMQRVAGTCIVEYYITGTTPCSQGTVLHECSAVAGFASSNKATYCDGTDGHALTEVCGWPCSPSFSGDDGPALQMRMAQTTGQAADPNGHIAYDQAGNLFFSDTLNNRIRKIDTSGKVSTVAGTGVYGIDAQGALLPSSAGGYSGDGGPAAMAELNHPVGLAIDTDGTIYFADTNNNCVRKIDAAGTISTVAGDCTTANDCGTTNSAACNSDVGPSCDPDPNVHCFAGDGGPPTNALLNHPYAVSLSGRKLYVSDTYNNRVRVVNLP